MSFGRPGYGAPVRTKSGRVRTQIRGNPEIRFQNNESVQKTINNAIRYQSNPELKSQYHRDLGNHSIENVMHFLGVFVCPFSEEQIRMRKELERSEKERDRSLAKEMVRI